MATQVVDVTPVVELDDGFAFIFSFPWNMKTLYGELLYATDLTITGSDAGGKISERVKPTGIFYNLGRVETIKYCAEQQNRPDYV
jgi:hypothetical protein